MRHAPIHELTIFERSVRRLYCTAYAVFTGGGARSCARYGHVRVYGCTVYTCDVVGVGSGCGGDDGGASATMHSPARFNKSDHADGGGGVVVRVDDVERAPIGLVPRAACA